MATDGTIILEGATIFWKNFAGKEGMYNAEGDRSFCVLIDDNLASQLEHDGWNVKQMKVREEGDDPQKYLQVSVKYRGRGGNQVRPPMIVVITSKGRTSLPEDMCDILDWVDIANVDLIIRPYSWAVSGKSGIKAYLKSIYVTVLEDALQLKYADVPEISSDRALTTGRDDVIDVEWDEIDENQLAIGK